MHLMATLSHLRRVCSPFNKEGKTPEPRQLDPSEWGLICLFETPDGQSCGLVNNIAIHTYISRGSSSDCIKYLLRDLYDVFSFRPFSMWEENTDCHVLEPLVLVNGDLIGSSWDPEEMVNQLRLRRRYYNIPIDITITYKDDRRVVEISTDANIAMRPLLVYSNLDKVPGIIERFRHTPFLWDELFLQGCIELLDKEEENYLLVCTGPENERYLLEKGLTPTHIEISPSDIFGICSLWIPYPEKNQAPRNTYQSGMGKHSMGIPTSNYQQRFDTLSYLFYYPQKPLVSTLSDVLFKLDGQPSGQNAVVAILNCNQKNVEDAVLIQKQSIERGFMRAAILRTYHDEENKQNDEQFEIPDPETCTGMQYTDYSIIDPQDGIISPGTIIKKGNPLVAKTMRISKEGKSLKKDRSLLFKHNETARVNKVAVFFDKKGNKNVLIETLSERIPDLGDKFSSRHGQKGVVGSVVPQEDMPFNCLGMSPDIIINTHGQPSRMTIGQLNETLLSKVGAIEGKIHKYLYGYSVPTEEIENWLVKCGFNRKGKELMFDGKTGEPIEAMVFEGPVFYQRLQQTAIDKRHGRNRGPVQIVNRQPLEGVLGTEEFVLVRWKETF
jgi:DNA-directed RNA polymerase II subunit RPB2